MATGERAERGRMLPLRVVARRVGFSVKTIRRRLVEGRFPRVQKVLGQWRIPEGDLDAFLNEERGRHRPDAGGDT
jgi:predicted site-specific integrase-resolvase